MHIFLDICHWCLGSDKSAFWILLFQGRERLSFFESWSNTDSIRQSLRNIYFSNTYSLSHTYTQSLSCIFSVALMHIHTLSDAYSHIHCFTHSHGLTNIHSLCLSLILAHLLSSSCTFSINSHTLSLTHTHRVSLSPFIIHSHTHKHTDTHRDILVLKYDLSIKSKHISGQIRENLKFYILEFINLPWQIKSDERDSLYPFGFGWKSPGMLVT